MMTRPNSSGEQDPDADANPETPAKAANAEAGGVPDDAAPEAPSGGASKALVATGLGGRITRHQGGTKSAAPVTTGRSRDSPKREPAPKIDPAAEPEGETAATRPAAGLQAAWKPERLAERAVGKALNRWQQGDLIKGIQISWLAPVGTDKLTGLDADAIDPVVHPATGEHPRLPIVSWDELDDLNNLATSGPGWGVVISQTCDIANKGPGERHFTVQVVPVICATGAMSDERIEDAKRGKVIELVHVPALTDIEGGDWFADLRISFPISKTVLVENNPIHGFPNAESGRLRLAEAAASKYRRPATHDAVSENLTKALSAYVAAARENGEHWADQIEQVRVAVREGDRLWPTQLQLIVIGHTNLRDNAITAMRRFRDQNKKTFKNATKDDQFAPDGCELLPPRGVNVRTMSVADYRDTVPLAVEGLSGAFW